MLFKLIVVGAVLYGLYRLAGGTLLPKKPKNQPEETNDDGDTLVECKTCGTYVVKKEALFYKGEWYCSRECLP
ncbi:PP0621 family protein [Nitratifractor sp.]